MREKMGQIVTESSTTVEQPASCKISFTIPMEPATITQLVGNLRDVNVHCLRVRHWRTHQVNL